MKKTLFASCLALTTLTAEEHCCPCFEGINSGITLRHREGDGIGYHKGYSTAAAFLTPQGINCWQYFLDIRAHRLRNNHFAANAGLGLRYSSCDTAPIYGLNAYYDYRDAKHLRSHQVGVGLETFFQWFDLRANGYLPVGDKFDKQGPKFKGFSGNNLLFKEKFRTNLPKVELEAGTFLPGIFCPIDLYAAAGPYYLFRRKKDHRKFGNVWGGQARLSAKPFNGLEIGLIYSYDKIYKSNPQGYISFTFPTGAATMRKGGRRWARRFGCGECSCAMEHVSKMVTPPFRSEIIPIQEKSRTFAQFSLIAEEQSSIVAELLAIFVDTTRSGIGTGTFEDPYTSLLLAETFSQENDLIYVFASGGEPYTNGITLKNGQSLISSGVGFTFYGIDIPPFPGDEGKRFTITATSGNCVIQLAEDNEIAGFIIDNQSVDSGICSSSPVSTLSIHDCTIDGTTPGTKRGLFLPLSGANTVSVKDSIIRNQNQGIFLTMDDTGGVYDVTLTGNLLTNNPTSGMFLNLSSSLGGPVVRTHSFDIQDNLCRRNVKMIPS